ncbi:HAD-IC family P-type ATPase, partial [Candidatus Collinsella stercoripullorum]|uniref:HAD-IC family P-type ATPase n=1 Tax=Candidatus Collinsella stercoripullorum TaxID=2838522 RepID=UPI0022DEF306
GIRVDGMLTGSEVEGLDDAELARRVENTQLFARLSPLQKARVVDALRGRGHVVGFMGDGINDAAALRAADAGISVDTAVDVAKETAAVILTRKDLVVLGRAVREGRRTYGNTIKYVKATASSNFGNMLSVLVASA